MSYKRLHTLSDLSRFDLDLRARCVSCGHEAVLSVIELSLTCSRRRWSRDIGAVEQRLRCDNCNGRDIHCVPVEPEA